MFSFCLQKEWFCRLAKQCCFAGHPKDQKTKANMPHEAIQILSVLNVKEVSDIVNHKVGFLPWERGENTYTLSRGLTYE